MAGLSQWGDHWFAERQVLRFDPAHPVPGVQIVGTEKRKVSRKKKKKKTQEGVSPFFFLPGLLSPPLSFSNNSTLSATRTTRSRWNSLEQANPGAELMLRVLT